MKEIFKAIDQEIKAAEKILIITHQDPDGDALGSALSLLIYLKGLNKPANIFATGRVSDYYRFLPYSDEISSDPQIITANWDLLIFVDVAAISYAQVETKYLSGKKIINLDHHFSNNHYGDIQAIDSRVSSTCELLYRFFSGCDIAINRLMAVCLLTGILTDTGGFTNSATTTASMNIASALIKRGAKIHQTMSYLVKNKSLNGLRLWGLVLSRLKINERYNLAYTYIKEEDYQKYQISEAETDGLINFLNVMAGVAAVLLIRLNNDGVKISLRTTQNNIDVSKIAALFDGGGHQKAAGFSVPWRLIEINGYLELLD